jgi:hypothetical protein
VLYEFPITFPSHFQNILFVNITLLRSVLQFSNGVERMLFSLFSSWLGKYFLTDIFFQGQGGPLLSVCSEFPILDANENRRRKPPGQYFETL